MNKKQLAVILSKLDSIKNPKVSLEQYNTDSEIASQILWTAFLNNDVKNKVIADLGCGNGILGIGALIFGAKKVYFIDTDEESISICKSNIKNLDLENFIIVKEDIKEFNKEGDVVIQNPPFGVKKEHADKRFIEKAFKVAKKIYSIHKIESLNFIKSISKDYGFKLVSILKFTLPIKKTYSFHKKKIYELPVGCFILYKL